ncbi:NUDIX domain-containing protein [Leucobacter luti]|uniref:NUDIX hydrolase n=1 Tax=Leucobacter luti TaxID=340320 RepID=UPI001044849C|nr:CoA pyrophosphatase [Leucobacter luti]MCW2288895.1 8-oxo-dGTP pyrophosphatase MutT (NUDIX family) [Leucobacter luti]TCK44953.1 NUDIX domain-containing protein [Leucobacter luti]
MDRSVAEAQRELRELMQRDFPLPFQPQGSLASTPLRHSAVLILFGALDRKPAVDGATTVPPELDVLLTRRADGMRHHAGQIAFPGGGVEAIDLDIVGTALREAHEETGLDPAGVEVLGALPAIHIPVSNNLVTPVVGWWRLPSEVAADHSESVEVFRTPVAELLSPAARGTSVLDRDGFRHRGAAFKLGPRFGEHTVWGFTGILLATLFDELGWAEPWDPQRELPVQP